MTIHVNIQEAQAQLSHLLAKASQGEEVIINSLESGQNCRLVPVETQVKKKRALGLCAGQVQISPEFFDPMSEEELALWYDAPLRSNDMPESD